MLFLKRGKGQKAGKAAIRGEYIHDVSIVFLREPWLRAAEDDSWGEGVTPVRVGRQRPTQVHFSETFSKLAQGHDLNCRRRKTSDGTRG